MVEYSLQLDSLFYCLSDSIRRDILERVSHRAYSIGELARNYDVSFAAISKHIMVLQDANLVHKRKEGKKRMIELIPESLMGADEYLEQYRQMWQGRHDKLEALLKEGDIYGRN